MNTKKIIAVSLATILVLGVIAMVGFLSFTGMLLIAPYVGVALGSFYFAAIVEGEVYKQNIFNGIKKLQTRDYTKKKILRKKLDHFLKDEQNLQNSQFLRDYQKQKKFLATLKSKHADQKIIQKQKKRLKAMKLFFARWVYEDGKLQRNALTDELDKLFSKSKAEIRKEISRKLILGRVAWIFYILAGISSGFAAASCIHSGLTTLMVTFGFVIAPSILFGGIIPLAIIAGIGYTLTLYHQVSDLIRNDKLQKWAKKILNYFKYNPQEDKFKYVARIIGVGLLVTIVVGLAVFATVATAGTWWTAVKQGARLIPFFAAAANWIRNITVPAMTFPTLIVNVKNSFETIQKLMSSSIKNKFESVRSMIKQTMKNETRLQFGNPFRIIIKLIEYPFKLLNILGHLIADSVMADNLASVPYEVTVALYTANEGLEHGGYFMEDQKKLKDEHHTTLVDIVLDIVSLIVLSTLYGLSFAWDYAFGKATLSDSFKKVFEPYIKFFDNLKICRSQKPTVEFPQPDISEEWRRQELAMKFEKRAMKYHGKNSNDKLSQKKGDIFTDIQTDILKATLKDQNKNIASEISNPITKLIQDKLTGENAILYRHRQNFFNKNNTPCKAEKFINGIMNNRDYHSLEITALP